MPQPPHRPSGSPTEPTDGGAAAHEDFLYHLYRGSSMLMDDHVVEAKEELERALHLKPQDARGQSLLAGVYFRLGLYPRAIEIWERLVAAYPKDSTLRVNLALALFKTGQSEQALEHLRAALRISPEHARAWGYVGLIQWRMGRIAEAHEAFLKGGQASMARRMEEMLASDAPAPQANPPEVADVQRAADAGALESQREAMREAAEQAIGEIEAGDLQVAAQTRRRRVSTGSWKLAEIGRALVPKAPAVPSPATPAGEAPAIGALAMEWSVARGRGEVLSVGPSGDLFVSAPGEVLTRITGLVALRGALQATPEMRTVRGRATQEPLGGPPPIMRVRGPMEAIFAPPEGTRLFAARLDGEALFVRETELWAFDETVSHDSASLPVAARQVAICELTGSGTVVVRLSSLPKAMRVMGEAEVRVEPERLLGWIGRLFPSQAIGGAPAGGPEPPLVFRGDGIVLLR